MNCFRNVLLTKTTTNFLIKNMSYYAVARGHQVGIFKTWAKCEEQVKGFKGAKYKKFKSQIEAEDFIKVNGGDLAKCAPMGDCIPLGKKGFTISLNDANGCRLGQLDAKVDNDDYWPECDGDNFDLGDNDLLLALQQAEEGETSASNSSKSKKRKCPDTTGGSSLRSKFPRHESKIWEPVGVEQIGPHNYKIDSEGFVICYTDGSCFNNGRKNASAGYGVFFDDDHPLNAAKPVKGRVTNNAGEIQAAIHAIKTAKSHGIKKICISTDSQFLINAITLWITAWKKKGWCLKNGDPVKNVDDFKELDNLLKSDDLIVKWNYVKGHKGIKGNEMADKLARQGTEIFKRMHKIH